MSDDELVELIRYGDENAAEELINRYYMSVLRYCKRHCSSIEKAEDITQETFLKLFKRLPEYREKRNFRAYLYTIANHLCIDESRKAESYLLENEEQILYERDEMQQIEDRAEIEYLLNRLSQEQKEAVTRASNAQIILAKLILAGASNLVCMTILISFEVYLQNSCEKIGQMVIYCLVPYLVCMVSMLRLIRLCRKESIQICISLMLGFCMGFWMLTRVLPWLYETSAFGLWVIAFLVSITFFMKEIYFIIAMRKEGKMYGIIT